MMFTPPELTKEMKKEIWGDGPWVDEPDFLEFYHKGINCIVRRHYEDGFGGNCGNFCGYVQIPKENTLHGKKDEIVEDELSVHGGITFDEYENGEHWVGFDCAHSSDFMPSMIHQVENPFLTGLKEAFMQDLKKAFPDFTPPKRIYKTWDFVIEETKKLAEQLL